MNRLLNSPQLNRLRDFMMTGKYMMLLFAVGAVFAAFEWNVAGVLVFACIISATLVICEDLLATFMPFMITCLIAAKCYNSYSTFIQYKSLGVIIALCLIAHFVLYWKKPDTKGALTKPMIFVSIAVVLGGVGFISKEEYFSPVSLFYILTLGFAMVVLYWMFYTYLTVRRDYSLIEKVTLIMVIAGCFASFVTIAFYLRNINEVLENRDLLYMQWRNNYSTFLMLSIPFAFLRGHKKPYSIMLGFFFYFCILLTGSRGGLVFGAVELAMCCILFILYDKRRRLTYIAICACLAFALLIFSREFFSFFGSTFDRLLSAINGVLIGEQQEVRYYQYIRGIQDFLNNPILGTGIGYMGNRDVYVVKGSDATALALGTDVTISGYINGQNNEVAEGDPLAGYPMFQESIATKGTEGTDAYVLGEGNQACWVYLTFAATAGETYYVFNKNTQIGFGGFEFTAGTAGINDITVDAAADENAPVYNLAGQRVSKDTKGILIQNGKKFVNK